MRIQDPRVKHEDDEKREKGFFTTLRMTGRCSAFLLLAACVDSTGIQREYVDLRDDCRTQAEEFMASTTAQERARQQAVARAYTDIDQRCPQGGFWPNCDPTGGGGIQVSYNEDDFAAQLKAVFSDCMGQRGWTVASPPREVGPGQAPAQPQQRVISRRSTSEASPATAVGAIGPSLFPGSEVDVPIDSLTYK